MVTNAEGWEEEGTRDIGSQSMGGSVISPDQIKEVACGFGH